MACTGQFAYEGLFTANYTTMPGQGKLHFGFIKRRVHALIDFSHPDLDCGLVILKVVLYQYC